jgi:hypothetical protein
MRPIRSLIAVAAQEPPEVAAFRCIDIVETTADKLSALAWRVRVRRRGEPKDDPTIIRHLHDLAALEPALESAAKFANSSSPRPRQMWAGEGRRILRLTQPSSSPTCCSGSK